MSFATLRSQFLGLNPPVVVTRLDGSTATVTGTYLDSAASCLMPRPVLDVVEQYLSTAQANSHTHGSARGRATTTVVDRTRALLLDLVHGDPETDAVVFNGSGSTGPLNLIAAMLPIEDGTKVVVSGMEHHSNMLPWIRAVGLENVRFVATFDTGELDMEDMARALAEPGVAAVAVTAMSNVTGMVNPIHDIARLAHAAGIPIVVDAAQAAPHVRIDMHPAAPEESLDFVVLSGHKLYAPGSPGVLIAAKEVLAGAAWKIGNVGGGIVSRVTLEEGVQLLEDPAARLEAGTPDLPGIVALGAAVLFLTKGLTLAEVQRHDIELTTYAMRELSKIPNAIVYGRLDPTLRGGIVTCNLLGIAHGLAAAVLNDFFGISVRNDCFCSAPYVRSLLDATCNQRGFCAPVSEVRRGMVRISFGPWVNQSDVAKFVEALKWIDANIAAIEPLYNNDDGAFTHKTFRPVLPFSLDAAYARAV